MEDIFQKDLSGEMVSPDELNTGHHTPDEVRDFLSRITGREIDPSDCHRGQGLDRHRPTVLPGVRIGYGAIVGANSVVTHDVPPMTVVGGNPVRFIKEIKPKAK